MTIKNETLPGVEGPGVSTPRIKAVDDAAEDYVKERDKRCLQTPKEIAAKTKLIDVLHLHAEKIGKDAKGVLRYQYDDLVVSLTPGKEKLKVKSAVEDDDAGDDD